MRKYPSKKDAHGAATQQCNSILETMRDNNKNSKKGCSLQTPSDAFRVPKSPYILEIRVSSSLIVIRGDVYHNF